MNSTILPCPEKKNQTGNIILKSLFMQITLLHTGPLPYHFLFERKPRLPVDIILYTNQNQQ